MLRHFIRQIKQFNKAFPEKNSWAYLLKAHLFYGLSQPRLIIISNKSLKEHHDHIKSDNE